MNASVVELVGYLASILVVASFAMKSVVRLRVVSLVGCVVFVAYGVLLGSIPLVLTNAAAGVLHLWYLRREFGPHRDLGAVPIAADEPFLLDFLNSHGADIAHFHPGFDGPKPGDFVRLLTRDGLPAGAVVATPDGSTLQLRLDYVMQAFRDSRIGAWLYGPGADVFTRAGFTTLVAEPESEALNAYLIRSGFTAENGRLVLRLRG